MQADDFCCKESTIPQISVPTNSVEETGQMLAEIIIYFF